MVPRCWVKGRSACKLWCSPIGTLSAIMVLSSDRARNIFNREVITSEESSESEFVEEEKPWPPTQDRLSRSRAQKQAGRVPRPHSHLFRLSGGRARGSKHARRWENCEWWGGEAGEVSDGVMGGRGGE